MGGLAVKTVHNERFFVDCLFKGKELWVFNRLGMIGFAGLTGQVGNLPHVGM